MIAQSSFLLGVVRFQTVLNFMHLIVHVCEETSGLPMRVVRWHSKGKNRRRRRKLITVEKETLTSCDANSQPS